MGSSKQPRLWKTLGIYTLGMWLLQAWAVVGYGLHTTGISELGGNISANTLAIPMILSSILVFLFMQAVVCVGLIVILIGITHALAKRFQFVALHRLRVALTLWIVAWLSIFIVNQALYPYSLFAFLPKSVAIQDMLMLMTWGAMVLWGLILLLALYCIGKKSIWFLIACMVVAILWKIMPSQSQPERCLMQQSCKPNIIIIGLDAVRPVDVTETLMPYTYAFLASAANFTEATTPLARTFPAWTSILTGNYPKQTHARYSLPYFRDLNVKPDLAMLLHKDGYHTVYSIDDRRFNNIDTEHFFFDQFIGPKMGFNDFLLGTINDFPLTNLLINTEVGRIVFPYNYANRADYKTYIPKLFNRLVERQLQVPQNKPLFLGIHFCLPHWNWLWYNAPFQYGEETDSRDFEAYKNSLRMADQQLQWFMATLKEKGLLKNAIVVLLSDHGQSFSFPSDQLLHEKLYLGEDNHSSQVFQQMLAPTDGHGTNILNFTQYHCMLAFKRFGGDKAFVTKNIDAPVNLIDVMPTVLNAINASVPEVAGESLLPYLMGETIAPEKTRPFYLETGFTLPGILISKKSLKTILSQGVSYFTVDPATGRCVIKPALGKLIIKGKQRAILEGDWMLVYMPIEEQDPIWILLNRKTGQWTDDLNSAFAKESPAMTLYAKLKAFYGDELDTSPAR